MSTKIFTKNLEKGQVLPIIVISMFALIAMAALLIDGGMLLSNRRTAQAAADAGALAGARVLCPGYVGDFNSSRDAANHYVGRNNADLFYFDENLEKGWVQVKTSITPNYFFYDLFGEGVDLTAYGDAEATCSPPRAASSTLPIAFPCRQTVYDAEGNVVSCKMNFYDESLTRKENIEAGNMIMIMTSNATKENCYDPDLNPEGVNCDADGDNVIDIVSNSADGWISLDGGPQFKEGWVTGEIQAPLIYPRTWLGTLPGTNTNYYKFLKDFYDKDFVIPIYDKQSPGDPKATGFYQLGDIDTYIRTGSGLDHYRIIGFAQFKLTCIHETGTDQTKDGSLCDFRDWLIKSPLHNYSKQPSLKSIEGYFTEGTISYGANEGVDLGLSVVQLTK